METPGRPTGRTCSAPSTFFALSSETMQEFLEKEDFVSLQPFITKQSFSITLKRHLEESLNQSKVTHIKTIINQYKEIIIQDTSFIKNLIRIAFDQNLADLAYDIFSCMPNPEPLLSSFFFECVRKEQGELLKKINETHHDMIEERETPLERAFFAASSPYAEKIIDDYPDYFEKNGQNLFENALATYHIKTIARLSRHYQISIPEEEINQCFIRAAQQNCLSFFTLPQIQSSSIPETVIIKALKVASKHDHNQVIYFIFKNYNVSVQTLCNSFLKAVGYNQTDAAKQLSQLITQQYQTCTMKELEKWYEYANDIYSQALNNAFTNQNTLLISLILDSPFPLKIETLSTLIEKTSGTLKKQLMEKALAHLPTISRKNPKRLLAL